MQIFHSYGPVVASLDNQETTKFHQGTGHQVLVLPVVVCHGVVSTFRCIFLGQLRRSEDGQIAECWIEAATLS
jgi:hypothetical protein